MADLHAVLTPPAPEVAPSLLGAVLHHGGVAVRITEVEAYDGERDPGSHAYRGRTARNAVMFGPAGHLYCYFTYGMHTCANVVCGPPGTASAVLLRAGEVVAGADVARHRRTRGERAVPDRDLARGPARLVQALGITLEMNGTDLGDPRGGIRLELARGPVPTGVRTGPRVGVRGPGGDGETFPWRFWLEGEPTVSVYRPAAPLRRRQGRMGPGQQPRSGRTTTP